MTEESSVTSHLYVAMTTNDETQTVTGDTMTSSFPGDAQFYFRCSLVAIGVVGTAGNALVLYALVASKQHKKHPLIVNQNAAKSNPPGCVPTLSVTQYTPPTRRNCQVESRRRCVRNSQLVGDSLDESERIANIESRRVGGMNAPVGSRRELVANSAHTADATQLDSCVASAVCIGH